MNTDNTSDLTLRRARRFSYGFVIVVFAMMGYLHLTTILLAGLFSYFALAKLDFFKRAGKWLALVLYLVVVAGIAYAIAFFINQVIVSLPEIAGKSIPAVLSWAQQNKIELPFTDYESLKVLAIEAARNHASFLAGFANFARGATAHFIYLVIGCVVAINLFINRQIELDRLPGSAPGNLYSLCCDEIAGRFASFYRSFATVMGAQILISAINTVLTAMFVLSLGFPHPVVLIGVTFLCGLIPVLGNLISNTVIVAVGFDISPVTALLALVFLVVIHKLEYFLNSKIIGERIRNPLWLTLLGLIVGERLMGIPGMILAPVVLHFIKVEASKSILNNTATPQPGTSAEKK